MIPEAPLRKADGGLVPEGDGWFVVNAREARWREGDFGAYTRFQGDAGFTQIGINIGVLQPGQPSCMYHREDNQEDFLVLHGECILILEGEERHLRQWDFVHCPAGVEHIFVGAGEGPCAVLMIGSRRKDEAHYPVNEVAARYDASVKRETDVVAEAYADWREEPWRPTPSPWPPS